MQKILNINHICLCLITHVLYQVDLPEKVRSSRVGNHPLSAELHTNQNLLAPTNAFHAKHQESDKMTDPSEE